MNIPYMSKTVLRFSVIVFFVVSSLSITIAQNINIPQTKISVNPPQYFELKTNEDGSSYLFHAGTNAVVQFVTREDLSFENIKLQFTQDYFESQNLVVQEKEIINTSENKNSIMYVCYTDYYDLQKVNPVKYTVMLFVGGNSNKTFFVTARFPELGKDLLYDEITKMFKSIVWVQ